MIYIGPIWLSALDLVMFISIFVLIAVVIGAYYINLYFKRKKYKQYDEERMRVFKERLEKINESSKKAIVSDEEVSA